MTRSGSYGEGARTGSGVPTDRPLADLTVELTRLLGDPDPEVREATAVATLRSWISQGVYDDLLVGLADGMSAGMALSGTTTERRIASACVLTACLLRAADRAVVPPGVVLRWSDRLLTWFAADTDRATIEAGSHALVAVATSAGLAAAESVVLLDVIADRVIASDRLALADLDAIAVAVLTIIATAGLGLDALEPFVLQLGRAAVTPSRGQQPDRTPEAFLRALYTHLALSREAFGARADLILLLVDVLREINPAFGAPPAK